MFCKKGVLKNFAEFKGKHLCRSLFLIKLQVKKASLRPEKNETPTQVFSGEFCEIFRNTYFYRTSSVAASGSGTFKNCSLFKYVQSQELLSRK